jgi:hypothetical protein
MLIARQNFSVRKTILASQGTGQMRRALQKHQELDGGASDLDPAVDHVEVHNFGAYQDPERPSRPCHLNVGRFESALKENGSSLLLRQKRTRLNDESLSVYSVSSDAHEQLSYTTIQVDRGQYGSYGRFEVHGEDSVQSGELDKAEVDNFWRIYGET